MRSSFGLANLLSLIAFVFFRAIIKMDDLFVGPRIQGFFVNRKITLLFEKNCNQLLSFISKSFQYYLLNDLSNTFFNVSSIYIHKGTSATSLAKRGGHRTFSQISIIHRKTNEKNLT